MKLSVHNGIWLKIDGNEYIKLVVLNDIHFPFCDTTAVALACKLIETIEPNIIVLNGDIVDFFGISKFLKDPARAVQFPYEIEVDVKLMREWFWERYKDVVWIYIEGNHENRMQSYIWSKAKELAGMKQLDWNNLLEVPENVFVLKRSDVPQPDTAFSAPMVVLPSLFISHGDSFRLNGNTVNVARCLFFKVLQNIVIGHWHRSDEYIQLDLKGHAHGAWVTPCLSLPRPHWDASRIWGQGITVIECMNKFFKVEIVKIIREDGCKIAFYGGRKISMKRQKGVNFYEVKRPTVRIEKRVELQAQQRQG